MTVDDILAALELLEGYQADDRDVVEDAVKHSKMGSPTCLWGRGGRHRYEVFTTWSSGLALAFCRKSMMYWRGEAFLANVRALGLLVG